MLSATGHPAPTGDTAARDRNACSFLTQERMNLSKTALPRDGRPVLASALSAQLIMRRPALTPSDRSGSGSQVGDRCPTHGSRVSSLSAPVMRYARVCPARFVVANP